MRVRVPTCHVVARLIPSTTLCSSMHEESRHHVSTVLTPWKLYRFWSQQRRLYDPDGAIYLIGLRMTEQAADKHCQKMLGVMRVGFV